ncbi:hypothetical protein QBC37DRAFT_379863 [Rhypophila decipiens]|uniref:Uncharacterized protein n=1 Tax=Rhypophila decipiens TaxID=261697 RepID=A0AAN6XVG3_9PEZI|nr:hypothetical protein QBC37DRAFT_379863 [Rhypophila decipiens]
MGFFKKDKHPSAAQQEQAIQQQQQLVTAQNWATHLQSAISQLQAQLSEQNRLVHLCRTESANLQTELQNTRRQLQSTQGNLNAEVFQRQTIDRRLQETDFEYTMRLSSLDDELARSRQVTDQLRQELSSSSGVAEQYRRENVNLKQALTDLRQQYEEYRQDASRRLQEAATQASPQGNGGPSPERAGSNRSSTGSPWGAIFANTQPPAELPAINTGHSGTVSPGPRIHVRQSQPQLRPSRGQTNPFRPASTTGARSSVHLPSAGIITTPTPNSTLQSPPPYQRNPPGSPAQGPNPQRQPPAFLVPAIRATPAPIEEEESDSDSDTSMPDQEESEEAQHRRAILESAEISRYEDRVRAAEASREQMQAQFTALSGEVTTLRKTLEEKDRELFVRDNQLEWVQQRAAALVRGDGDSLFLVDL